MEEQAPFIYRSFSSDGTSSEAALLKAAFDGNLDRIKGVTPFMASAQSGDISTVKYLFDHGGDLMKPDTKGRTVLHHAVCSGSSTVTEFLLSKGIPVDIDYGFGTPLYHACINEQDKTVKILLNHHANPNTISCGIGTPLNGALIYRSLKCMKLLIKASIFLDSFCLLPLCWLFFCLLKPSGPVFPRFSKLYCAILLTGNSCELAIAAKECLA
ncbi:ankyrin repeat and SOCS box protein 13-like isoform X3 [Panicum virgatum]|uniref:ankyrin repeat and SOCS box protein 13-like isoform X3 n=1 Tax=Panicum virgatum TaxID=38727 RepID=UPI0019D58DCD|nr:ankyrin repeat and SOCS box protein 13-like isoform X3 [Panicum virgatum]